MEPFKAILSLSLIFFTLSVMGAWVLRLLRVEGTAPTLHPFVGWALYVFLALAIGTFNAFGVMGAAVIFFSIALFASLKLFSKKMRVGSVLSMDFVGSLILCLPLLYGVAEITAHAWDDFSQWLPNSLFLFQNGSFPTPATPVISSWPVYPYGFSLLIASLGWFQGGFVESAGPLINTALLILFTLFLGSRLHDDSSLRTMQRLTLFALLFLTLIYLNPGFNEFLFFSSYSETPTAVLLGLLVWLGCDIFREDARKPAILFALLGIVFVELRQANVFILIILTFSLALAHLPQLKSRIKPLLLMLVPPLAAAFIWHMYASQFFSLQGFSVATHWQWPLLGPLLAGMADVALRKWGYFLLLAALCGWGIISCFKDHPHKRLAITVALLIGGYSAFLLLAYMGSNFSEYEIRNAASFFRYMNHLNLAAMMVVIAAVATPVKTRLAKVPYLIPLFDWAIVLAVPVIGFMASLNHWLPHPARNVTELRTFAHGIQPALQNGTKAGVMVPAFDGVEANIIAYEWELADKKDGPRVTGRFTRFDAEKTPAAIQDFAAGHVVVIVGPSDRLAWQTVGRTPENRWAAFTWQTKSWDMITPQQDKITK